MKVQFTLYEGFLIADYQEDNVKAYRSREFYAGNTTSYETSSPANIKLMIDEASDHGDFTDAEYSAVMQLLGRTGINVSELEAPEQEIYQWGETAQLAQEKKYQVSPNGALLHDVLASMEAITQGEGYGPLEGEVSVSKIVYEPSLGVSKGYTRNDVENVLKLALGAGFVYEVQQR